MTLGVALSSGAIIISYLCVSDNLFLSEKSINQLSLAVLLPVILLAHLTVAHQIRPIEITRSIQSLGVLSLIVLSAYPLSEIIFRTEYKSFNRGFNLLCFLFILSALFGLFGIQPPTLSNGAKLTFPFTEPSFFAFTIVPILTFKCIISNVTKRVFWLISVFILALLIKNLTLIAACALVGLVALPLRIAMPAIVVMFYGINQIDLSYFQERLDLTTGSENLSALVYAQGWQLLDESLRSTYGWGLGFQQLGFGYTNVAASYRIYYILGRDSNLVDGGFLLAKLGSEIGIAGIILVFLITINSVRSMIILRLIAMGQRSCDKMIIFALSSTYSIVLEIYVRGVGYFTGTTLLCFASVLYIWRTPIILQPVRSDEPEYVSALGTPR